MRTAPRRERSRVAEVGVERGLPFRVQVQGVHQRHDRLAVELPVHQLLDQAMCLLCHIRVDGSLTGCWEGRPVHTGAVRALQRVEERRLHRVLLGQEDRVADAEHVSRSGVTDLAQQGVEGVRTIRRQVQYRVDLTCRFTRRALTHHGESDRETRRRQHQVAVRSAGLQTSDQGLPQRGEIAAERTISTRRRRCAGDVGAEERGRRHRGGRPRRPVRAAGDEARGRDDCQRDHGDRSSRAHAHPHPQLAAGSPTVPSKSGTPVALSTTA